MFAQMTAPHLSSLRGSLGAKGSQERVAKRANGSRNDRPGVCFRPFQLGSVPYDRILEGSWRELRRTHSQFRPTSGKAILTSQVDWPKKVQTLYLPLKWSSQKTKSPPTQEVRIPRLWQSIRRETSRSSKVRLAQCHRA